MVPSTDLHYRFRITWPMVKDMDILRWLVWKKIMATPSYDVQAPSEDKTLTMKASGPYAIGPRQHEAQISMIVQCVGRHQVSYWASIMWSSLLWYPVYYLLVERSEAGNT